jgi:hypothetical protein
MKIGFDLDRVFINYPPFMPGFIIDYLYKNHGTKKLSYRIPSSPVEIFIRRASHWWIFRPPIQQNIDYLHSLAKTGKHELYLISSRYGFLRPQTEFILNKYGLIKPFKQIYLNLKNEQAHEFKKRIIDKLGIDLFIDDDSDLINFLASSNSQIKLFHCFPPHRLEEIGQLLT